jgi:Outer membrane protein beta-barrel domain
MKFILLSVLTLCIIVQASSQVRFNIFAGPQATTSHYTINDTKQPSQLKYGFQAGAGLKIPFEDKLSFSPAAFYSMKGYKVKFNQYAYPPSFTAKDNNTTIHTFETAFLLQYDLSRQPGHCFLKGGPSLDFQLFGKEKFTTLSDSMVNRNMKFGFADYGHFSANMLLQFGYESPGGLLLFAQYSYGLTSINNTDGGPRIRNLVYGISIGKYISRKKK